MFKNGALMLQVRFGKIVFLVVALAAVGQFANTIYVPAITMIAASLKINAEHAQWLMTGYLLPYGCTQFIYGPLSDLYGRRPLILIGLSIFLAGSCLTVFATHFDMLFIGCLIQGLGAGVAGVMARTVMRDCYQDHKLYRANSIIAFALILAPLLAPVVGGLLSAYLGWRSDFIFLFLLSTIILGVEYFLFPETHLNRPRDPHFELSPLLAKYRQAFSSRNFKGYLLCMAFSFAGIAIFEASAGILLTRVLHYSPKIVSLLFVVPIPGYMFGSYGASYINRYYSLHTVLRLSLSIITGGVLTLLIPALLHIINIYVILIPVTIYMFGSGLLFPTPMTPALNPLGEIAGTAGAILGGVQNLCAGILTGLFTFIPQTTQRPLALALSLCCICILFTFKKFIQPNPTLR